MNVQGLLDNLKEAIRAGALTSCTKVDSATLVCLKETNAQGLITNYHQIQFDILPDVWQGALKNKVKGETVVMDIGAVKVIAVFDIWEQAA